MYLLINLFFPQLLLFFKVYFCGKDTVRNKVFLKNVSEKLFLSFFIIIISF